MDELGDKYMAAIVDPHHFKGYIQGILYQPFGIILTSGQQILEFLKHPYAFDDATGELFIKPKGLRLSGTTTKLFYYALVKSGKNTDYGALPTAVFITANHNMTTIKIFLEVFCTRVGEVSKKRIKTFESDFSLVLLDSTCSVFNGLSLIIYPKFTFDV